MLSNIAHDAECWISKRSLYLCLYIPVIFAYMLSIMLLIVIVFNIYHKNQITVPIPKFRKRLLYFCIVYMFMFTGPMYVRVKEVIYSDYTPSVGMVIWHHFLMGWGFANYIVWSHSENFQHVTWKWMYQTFCCKNHRPNDLQNIYENLN